MLILQFLGWFVTTWFVFGTCCTVGGLAISGTRHDPEGDTAAALFLIGWLWPQITYAYLKEACSKILKRR